MRRIVILADDSGRQISEWTQRFCAQHGLFPAVELHEDSKGFYDAVKKGEPSGVIIALSGVAGIILLGAGYPAYARRCRDAELAAETPGACPDLAPPEGGPDR